MPTNKVDTAFLEVGFRPFFLGAALYAVLVMGLWFAIYLFQLPIPFESLSPLEWHAHEMLFGYSMAVISGFLLTSVQTWSKLATAHGKSLLFLFSLWSAARLFLLFGSSYIWFAALCDILFNLWLLYILAHRIIKARQWKQLGIIAKVFLITACNLMFYLGTLGWLTQGITWGIYGALYIIMALILTMGRRVIPFFIERATKDTVQVFNSKWVDISNLCLFLIFAINEVFFGNPILSAYLALALSILNAFRLIRWYHPIIWKQSLLWSIYLSFWLITLGFLFMALPYFAAPYIIISKQLALHAFTIGGIGAITLGMMARVSLAHTGRDVYAPPKSITYAFVAIFLSAFTRVILPLFDIWPYDILIGLSQCLWMLAFLIFLFNYAPILIFAKQE